VRVLIDRKCGQRTTALRLMAMPSISIKRGEERNEARHGSAGQQGGTWSSS
jgi:hypothetical protein